MGEGKKWPVVTGVGASIQYIDPRFSRVLDAANDLKSGHSGNIGFFPSILCQTFLPCSKQPDEVRRWESVNGHSAMQIEAGTVYDPSIGQWIDIPLPYGAKARLALIHLSTLAIKNRSPIIPLNSSMTGFLKTVINRRANSNDITGFKLQMSAIGSATIRLATNQRQANSHIVADFDLMWLKCKGKRVLWPSEFILSPTYWEGLKARAVPIDLKAMGAAISAGVNAMAAQAAVGIVANKGDIGATLKGLASSDSLKSIAASMILAGVMNGISGASEAASGAESAGDTVTAATKQAELIDNIQSFATKVTVKTALQATLGGEDFDEALKSSLLSSAQQSLGAYIFNKIGDLGLENGSPLKAVVHGVAGGFLAELGGQEFSTGAIAAASAELLSTSLAEISDPQMRAQMAGAIAATGAMLAGGDAEDVQLANQTAQMVITYNHNMHPDFKTKMNAQLAKAKEEGDDKYGDLDQEKLAELQEVCGDTHCFNTFWGGIDTNKTNKYLSENGGTAYSPETLEAYADLHSSTEDILLTENNDLNWGIINNPDGSGQIVKMEPLYIPDENDYKAAALLLQQNGMMPDDVYNQLDEAEWNQFNTDLEAARQLDPALGEAFSFMESEQNKQLLAFVAAEALGEAGPLVLAKIIAAVRVAKLRNSISGTTGNWSMSGTASGEFIETVTTSNVKVKYSIHDNVDGYIIAKGPDGNNYVFGSDPLKGISTGTLDTRWNDVQLANQLEIAKKAQLSAKTPETKTKITIAIESMRAILRILGGPGDQ